MNEAQEETQWVPIYIGRRYGKCATRKHKTHNKKAIRHTRKHGPMWPKLITGTFGRWDGMRMIDSDTAIRIEFNIPDNVALG